MKYNPFSILGKTILVTGASSGIGSIVALECAKLGGKLIITGRNEERLKNTYDQLSGTDHLSIVADLSSEEGLNLLVNNIPYLDGIVHCAGIIKRIPLKFIKEDSLDEVMRTNLYAPALITQKLHKKKLIKEKASIVFISSIASAFASYGNIMYMASKGAINSLSKGIAFEVANQGIRVNSIQPGMIYTNLTKAISDNEIQEDIKRYPLGRYGKAEEIAYAVIYLLSDATEWMTGSVLTIDGGITLR